MATKTRNKVKHNYKDGIFRNLFDDEQKLISLYNAITCSCYPSDTKIEIVTLENAVFGGIKNDLSFIIEDKLIVFIEHQSTVNPNLPLRIFTYLARQLEKYVSSSIYSTRLVHIPTPEIYVFYNGKDEQPLEQELKFSDAFTTKCDKIFAELKVIIININYEKGSEILKRSKELNEYSMLIYEIRKLNNETGNLQYAVEEGIRICKKKGILTEFLRKHGGDIMSFLYEELTREECEAIREQDGYEKGREAGRNEGFREGIKKGEISGIAQGERNKSLETAKKMKEEDLPYDLILRVTGLSESEIKAL